MAGNEGDTLTVTGHTLSLTPSENQIFVGTASCEVLTAETSTSFTPPTCPVATCAQQMQTAVTLTCQLPFLDSIAPHTVTVATASGGNSPLLAAATVTATPQLRQLSPVSGSVAGAQPTGAHLPRACLVRMHACLIRSRADPMPDRLSPLSGGTSLTLRGDGFSPNRRDLEVSVGGRNCRILSTNVTTIMCVTPVAATTSVDSSVAVVVRVRGVAATAATNVDATFQYSRMRTPILTGATVTSSSSTEWSISLSGTFGDGSASMSDNAVITVGSGTPCALSSGASTSALACVSPPPLAGAQTITLVSDWGFALGAPMIQGTSLAVTSFTPAAISLAGGATLTIAGAGFSLSDTSVRVCNAACAVRARRPLPSRSHVLCASLLTSMATCGRSHRSCRRVSHVSPHHRLRMRVVVRNSSCPM